MLTDFLYKYISNDKNCLLGLIPDENKFALLLSPLNANTLYPKLSSIETEYWIKKYSIINDENVKISNKSFISNDTRYDWSISTGLNILGKTESTGSNFTFSSKIKINNSDIGDRIVPIFKQGTSDVNDTLDIHFEFNRETDPTGSLDKLVINVFYETPSDSVALNLQSFELLNIWTLVNRDVQLTIIIDSENSVIKVFSDNELIGSKTMDLASILDLPLNTPQNRSGTMNLILGGSKFMEMKNAYVWNRALSPLEIQFLNKINSERYEKPIDLPEDMDSLTFTAIENSSLKILAAGNPTVNGIQYRTNLTSSWKPYNIGDVIFLNKNNKVQFKNTENTLSISENDYVYFVMAGKIESSGNIQSMLNYSNNCVNWCFYNLFKDCISLIKVPNLTSNNLASNCYRSMFINCTSLMEAPELNTTELADSCYRTMFQGCTSLKQAPELPALTLKTSCYVSMFQGCTSLKRAPELPATNLNQYCYYLMFNGCSSIIQAPELPATELADSCYYGMFKNCINLTYPPNLLATEISNSCYREMFQGCESLKQAPELPAMELNNYCYTSMFRYCTSLTQINLPASALIESCYRSMFQGCSSLSSITVNFTEWNDSINATNDWTNGVSMSGEFYMPFELSEEYGNNRIPNDWDVLNFSEQEES